VPEQTLLDGLGRFDPVAVHSGADWYGAVPKAALASIGLSLDAVRLDAGVLLTYLRTGGSHRPRR
jgi:hypothetical protein